jgi:hypothetical protein
MQHAATTPQDTQYFRGFPMWQRIHDPHPNPANPPRKRPQQGIVRWRWAADLFVEGYIGDRTKRGIDSGTASRRTVWQ